VTEWWRALPAAERWRALRLVVAASFGADAARTVTAIVVQILAAANATLSGLWVKLLADGASRGAPAQMLVGAGGLALFVCGDVLLNAIGGQVNWVLREKTVHNLDGELLAAVAGAPGLALHEDDAQLTQLELWQAESWQFSQAVPALVALLFFAARLGLAGVLLAGISPVLLLLPLFSVPALLLSGQTSGLYLRGLPGSAPPSRETALAFAMRP